MCNITLFIVISPGTSNIASPSAAQQSNENNPPKFFILILNYSLFKLKFIIGRIVWYTQSLKSFSSLSAISSKPHCHRKHRSSFIFHPKMVFFDFLFEKNYYQMFFLYDIMYNYACGYKLIKILIKWWANYHKIWVIHLSVSKHNLFSSRSRRSHPPRPPSPQVKPTNWISRMVDCGIKWWNWLAGNGA